MPHWTSEKIHLNFLRIFIYFPFNLHTFSAVNVTICMSFCNSVSNVNTFNEIVFNNKISNTLFIIMVQLNHKITTFVPFSNFMQQIFFNFFFFNFKRKWFGAVYFFSSLLRIIFKTFLLLATLKHTYKHLQLCYFNSPICLCICLPFVQILEFFNVKNKKIVTMPK